MKYPRLEHRSRGFTLIELLVVIGIIMILIGLLVLGFRHLNAVAAKKETVAELHVCRGLLQEYENHNGLNFITPVYAAGTAILLPQIGKTNPNKPPLYIGDMSDRSSGALRYTVTAVVNTKKLMASVLLVPNNRTVVMSLPNKRILEPDAQGGKTADSLDAGAVILDGWGNPIILVPAAGLHVQIFNQQSGNYDEYIVRSTAMFLATDAANHPLTGADRPFWASAGQDGDFTLGEDNIYSFQE